MLTGTGERWKLTKMGIVIGKALHQIIKVSLEFFTNLGEVVQVVGSHATCAQSVQV